MVMRAAATPWKRGQIQALALVNMAGALTLSWAWGVSSRTASLGSQVRWLDLAIVATVLVAGADALWLATGRRRILARRSGLLGGLLLGPDSGIAPASDTDWWHLPGTSRAHRAGCQLIAGKPAAVIYPGTPQAKGLRACEICTCERGVSG